MSNLQRQVLENQKTILGLLNQPKPSTNGAKKQRNGSNDSQSHVHVTTGLAKSANLRKKNTALHNQGEQHQTNSNIAAAAAED